MTLTAFLHGYPPGWSMGGEVSTHRTLREVPGTVVFTGSTEQEYELDGVRVLPSWGPSITDIMAASRLVDAKVLFAHSTLSLATVRAARSLKIPSLLAVHAPRRHALDIRQSARLATTRIYNTEEARRDWRDPRGLVLHPPVGPEPKDVAHSTGNAITMTSSLRNKGAERALALARIMPEQRFILVESPAHVTHGDPDFWEQAAAIPNVEVWPRLHPDEMGRLWAETRVLIVPSNYETYGLSALEAAWHGIPSVHVDTGHVREGIGTAARLLRTRGIGELCSAVEEVLLGYESWSDRARRRVEALSERESRELAAFAAHAQALLTL